LREAGVEDPDALVRAAELDQSSSLDRLFDYIEDRDLSEIAEAGATVATAIQQRKQQAADETADDADKPDQEAEAVLPAPSADAPAGSPARQRHRERVEAASEESEESEDDE
jgi:hypothetical protein